MPAKIPKAGLDALKKGADNVVSLAKPATDKVMATYNELADIFPNLMQIEPPIDMAKNIGRDVRFIGGKAGDKSRGTIHDMPHTIIGVQKNYKGDLSYRVISRNPDGTVEDNIGRVANPKELEFIEEPIYPQLDLPKFAEGGLAKAESINKYSERIGDSAYPDERHNGRADAMRHMLASALYTQKYNPYVAGGLGWLNEIFSLDPMEERVMDVHNNAIGRELGEKYTDRELLLRAINNSITQGEPKIMTGPLKNYGNSKDDQLERHYAAGGLVGCECQHKFAKGGIVPSANGFMVGGLNIINPKSQTNGPFNVQWNTNNMLAASRAQDRG